MISANSQKEVWEKLNSIERRLQGLSQNIPPADAQYVVMALNATLTDERRLQASEGIALADGGAGGDADLTLDINGLVEDAAGASGDFFVYYDTVAGDHKKIDWDDMPGGGGASYWTQVGVDIYYDDGGSVIVGTIAKSSKMTEGITIFQGTSDNEILALQSSDVNHGITTWADTDTFFNITKNDAARGGIFMSAFTAAGATRCMNFGGWSPSVNTSKSPFASHAIVEMFGIKTAGATFTNMSANANLFKIYTYISNNWYGRFLVDAEGDVYQSGDLYVGNQSASGTPLQTIRRKDSNNIWIGINGGAAWTTGDRNYSLGDFALDAINSGSDNIGIGYNALTQCTTGYQNIAIGHDALENLTTNASWGNIAIGIEALESHSSGVGIVAIGYQAAWNDNAVPNYNIYIGHEAGQTTNNLGANCIFMGYHVGQNNTGAENVFIGFNVVASAGAGYSNTIVGSQSGQALAAGARNSVFGADAFDNLNSGNDNVGIGYQAGDGTSSGSQNVFIGSQADGNAVAARINAIGIGYNVSVDADNKIIIGNASHTVAVINGALFLPVIKSGANQAGAGAAANELWKTNAHAALPDNVVMIGV